MSKLPVTEDALKELLFKMADDQLIIGHRNSEWTGIGPMLEEDIAFSSLAQDKIGHSWNIYQILEKLGEGDPDNIAFRREEKDLKCCHLVELPIGEYDFSLVRHFLFDHAEMVRFRDLENSSYEPLANLAQKYRGEIKYHVYHADTWLIQLAKGTEESHARLQTALKEALPYAWGIFEESPYEKELIDGKVISGESALKDTWIEQISPVLEKAGLDIPDLQEEKAETGFGGRKGYHTEHLKPLLDEMREVLNSDPEAEW